MNGAGGANGMLEELSNQTGLPDQMLEKLADKLGNGDGETSQEELMKLAELFKEKMGGGEEAGGAPSGGGGAPSGGGEAPAAESAGEGVPVDIDGDGEISGVEKELAAMDKNKDGKVSKEEFKEAAKQGGEVASGGKQ